MATNRKRFEEFVLEVYGKATKGGGNRAIYERIFASMDDTQFNGLIDFLRKGNPLPLWSPGGVPEEELHYDTLKALCDEYGVKVMQRVITYDEDTGIMSMTPNEVLVGWAEIRAQRQFQAKKFNGAKNDHEIDDFTGQVMGRSRATGISQPEITVLRGLGLTKMANELYNVKGGDADALKAYKNDLLTTGKTTTDGSLQKGSGTKILGTIYHLFRGRHIDSNINKKT